MVYSPPSAYGLGRLVDRGMPRPPSPCCLPSAAAAAVRFASRRLLPVRSLPLPLPFRLPRALRFTSPPAYCPAHAVRSIRVRSAFHSNSSAAVWLDGMAVLWRYRRVANNPSPPMLSPTRLLLATPYWSPMSLFQREISQISFIMVGPISSASSG